VLLWSHTTYCICLHTVITISTVWGHCVAVYVIQCIMRVYCAHTLSSHVHYTTLQYTKLHCTDTEPHCAILYCITLYYTTLHCTINNSVETGRAFLLFNAMEPLAVKKYENFEQLRCLYPEFRCVFIGDNGQGKFNVF
jgi:hypothetical protein